MEKSLNTNNPRQSAASICFLHTLAAFHLKNLKASKTSSDRRNHAHKLQEVKMCLRHIVPVHTRLKKVLRAVSRIGTKGIKVDHLNNLINFPSEASVSAYISLAEALTYNAEGSKEFRKYVASLDPEISKEDLAMLNPKTGVVSTK